MLVRLPVPPSTNNLFVNKAMGKGRFISPAYKAWRTAAGWALNLARLQPFGLADVQVTLHVPEDRRRDIDNYGKAVLDLIVAHNLIADDNQVCKMTTERHDESDCILCVMPYSRRALTT